MLEITKPTLLLDKSKVMRNISRMAEKARLNGITLRPHFKTHQSVEVGEWFKDEGISRITVSSLDMALKFASAGWGDITIAFPVNILEIEKINYLAGRITLNLLLESEESVVMLNRQLSASVGIFIKIDSGYGRTGIDWSSTERIRRIISLLSRSSVMSFKGFLIHAGHSYKLAGTGSRASAGVKEILDDSLKKIAILRKEFFDSSPGAIISYGDTPSCSIGERFDGIDEFRPGNFVFYDLMQQSIGACSYNDIAVAMACPVVSLHPERMEVVIYGGAVHFSKDYLMKDGQAIFGQVVNRTEEAWGEIVKGAHVVSLSQEHGIVSYSDREHFKQVKVGDLLYIYPVHSCLTADCMGGYLCIDGETMKTLYI